MVQGLECLPATPEALMELQAPVFGLINSVVCDPPNLKKKRKKSHGDFVSLSGLKRLYRNTKEQHYVRYAWRGIEKLLCQLLRCVVFARWIIEAGWYCHRGRKID